MKKTEFLRTEPNLYLLNGEHKGEIIAMALAEKLKRIMLENDPNISIRIDAVKREPDPYDVEPFFYSKGLFSCRIGGENVLLRLEEVLKILQKDWYDYKITYEVNKEEKP